jgi:hypothetical protein
MMKYDRQKLSKTITAFMVVSALGLVGAGTASATHTHSKKTGNGSCVLLAQNGAEKDVVLPFVTEGQAHPLHVLVHKGKPGGNFMIGVAGTASDPCLESGEYLND